MILLYGIATFAETGIGIWMFGKMFPRRESVSNSWVARIILWTLLILTTYTMHRAYGKEYIYEKYFFICIYLVIIILNVAVYKYGIFFRIDEKTMKVILFIYIGNVNLAVLGVVFVFFNSNIGKCLPSILFNNIL